MRAIHISLLTNYLPTALPKGLVSGILLNTDFQHGFSKFPIFNAFCSFLMILLDMCETSTKYTCRPNKYRTSTGQVSESVKRVLLVAEREMKSADIQNLLQLKHRENFRDNYLIPALNEGILEMTIPDKPNSSKQKYRLTQKGIEMKMQRG